MKVRVPRSPELPPGTSEPAVTIPEVSRISEVVEEVKKDPETSSSEDKKSESPPSPAKSVGDTDSHCKLVQKQLVLLLHSHACLKKDGGSSPEERPRCVVPNCQMMRGVWIHLKACEVGPSCVFRHCSSSQKILAHWKACRVIECPVCHIVRLKWAQMQVAKEAAAASSSLINNSSSVKSHLDESSGQSTTSLSQGYGQGQGRLPHRTMEQGSDNGVENMVDNQLNASGNKCNEPNVYGDESNGNAAATTTGSSSFLEGARERSHTCHGTSSTMLQANQLYNQQVQQQIMQQQLRQSSRYHRPAYHKLMAHLPQIASMPNNLQFQSQQRHPHVHGNENNNRQLQSVMNHYVDDQSVPPSLMMTMTLTRDDNSKRKIHDSLPCPSLCKVRICGGSGNSSSDLHRSHPQRNCQCRGLRHSQADCEIFGHRNSRGDNRQQQRSFESPTGNMEASAVASFQEMIDDTLGCNRVSVPNTYEEQSAPSANDVRMAYERLGIPCPSDALNRLLATLPGGSTFLSAVSSEASSECGSEFDSQSSPALSRRNSEDDGIEDAEYNTVEDDCQVSFCLSLVQRLVAKRNDDPHVDDTDNDDCPSS